VYKPRGIHIHVDHWLLCLSCLIATTTTHWLWYRMIIEESAFTE